MAILEYKIPARLSINAKEHNGLLLLSSNGLIFNSSKKEHLYRRWNWADVQWTAGIEILSVVLFIKKEVPYFIISSNNSDQVKFYFSGEDATKLERILSDLKKEALQERNRFEVERKRQEELAHLEAEKKRQEELTRLEAERKYQEDLITFESDPVNSNIHYLALQDRINDAWAGPFSFVGKRVSLFLLEFFDEFLRSKEKDIPFDDLLYNEALVLFDEAQIPTEVVNAFATAMEYAFDYCQYEVAMLSRIFDSIVKILGYGNYSHLNNVYNEEYSLTHAQVLSFIDHRHSFEAVSDDEAKALNKYIVTARDHIDLMEQRATARNHLINKIYKYILTQMRPVTREHLKEKFPECTRNIFQSVAAIPEILDYQDRYIACRNMKIDAVQIEEFNRRLEKFLSNQENVCHVEQIFINLRYSNQSFFAAGYIETSQQLYTYLAVFAKDRFTFEYPFIALRGTKIDSPESKLKEFVVRFKEIPIDQVLAYAKEHYVKNNGVLELLLSLDTCMFIKNRENMVRKDSVSLFDEDISEIEALICEELEDKGFCAIRDLDCIVEFPYCNVPYDEWFIYSILHSKGKILTLQSTPGQFRYSLPVVSLYDEVSREDLQSIVEKHTGKINIITEHKVDDLNDLDSLIADEIELDDIEDFLLDDEYS